MENPQSYEHPGYYKKELLIERIRPSKKEEIKNRTENNRIHVSYEPKRKNRFTVKFPEKFCIEPFFVKVFKKPKYDFTKKGWHDIGIEFYDPIAPSASKAMLKLIENINKGSVDGFDLNLELLDPVGCVTERWILKRCTFIEVDFGECDYYCEELSTITAKIKFSKAIIN